MDKGSIHIYCGEGKGKSTAAIGQGIQAACKGKSVIIIQFLKGKDACSSEFIERLEPEIKVFRFQKSEASFDELSEESRREEIQNLKNGLNFARKVLVTEECDLLILDEVLGLVDSEIVDKDEICNLLEAKHEDTGIILTGKYSGKELWEYADEVTEMVTRYKA